MRRHCIRAIMVPPRRRTTDSRHDLPIAPNLIAPDLTAPNRVWLADITYSPTAEGWLYLAAVMDLFRRSSAGRCGIIAGRTRIRGTDYHHPAATAAERIDPPLRSLQYASHAYRNVLTGVGIMASLSRRADCYDNAPDGELLPYLENGAGPSSRLQHACRGPARYLRLDRGFLQPNKTPLPHRICRPDRNGAKSRLTRPLFRGKITSSDALGLAVWGLAARGRDSVRSRATDRCRVVPAPPAIQG
ncbi:hypothetical protein ABH973_000809 [Bradyrhizobium ottawaense]